MTVTNIFTKTLPHIFILNILWKRGKGIVVEREVQEKQREGEEIMRREKVQQEEMEDYREKGQQQRD